MSNYNSPDYDPVDYDPSQNFTERENHSLDSFFKPKNIAIIGATEKESSVGRTLLENLMQGFKGEVFAVNPSREAVLGYPCYKSVLDIPKKIDLAIIITPAKTVPGIIEACTRASIPAAIIISAGFKESGAEGIKAEEEVLRLARIGGMRIIGPNCLGLMNPLIGMNATFAADSALPGQLAFISQSGAMCTAVLDWSLREKIGFSSFISIGSMSDINFGDLISYLGSDSATSAILIYMETIGDARSFLSAAREVALTKPIIVIKAGRTAAAATAAASHTGSLAGSDDVFNAAIRRAGVLRAWSIEELFDMALALSKQPRPKGPNLTLITNAGGPGVLATDATILSGCTMALPPTGTIDKLSEFLPAAWSHANPVDLLGDASPEMYAQVTELIHGQAWSDGIVIILSPQSMTNPTKTAQLLSSAIANNPSKIPILASWMGGKSVEEGAKILNAAGIPTYPYPDNACKTFGKMWEHQQLINLLYATPTLRAPSLPLAYEQTERLLAKVRSEGRTLLTEEESKRILKLYGIPVVETLVATNADEAIAAAESIGYPIVVKLHSETITHKSDVGGVKLNLKNSTDVARAFAEIKGAVPSADFLGVTVQPMVQMGGYEIILGSSVDPQFGPVLLFGTGGKLVEVYKDSALALPPLNSTLARHLMEQTKIYTALQGVRGEKAVSLDRLESILIAFSQLISAHPLIKESDINPLLVSSETMIALDARFVLHENLVDAPKLAIRPYPIEYISAGVMRDGTPILFRPVRAEDESLLIEFHKTLSESTVKQRYLKLLSFEERTAHERLIRIAHVDYDKSIPIVAEISGKIVGLARLNKLSPANRAELKMTVIDGYQKQGIGRQLLTILLGLAAAEGITLIQASVHTENSGMLHLCHSLGFTKAGQDNNIIYLTLKK